MIRNAKEQSFSNLENDIGNERIDIRVDPFAWHTNDPPDLCWDAEPPICPFTMDPYEVQCYENPRVPTYMVGFFWMSLEPCAAEAPFQLYNPSEIHKKGGI